MKILLDIDANGLFCDKCKFKANLNDMTALEQPKWFCNLFSEDLDTDVLNDVFRCARCVMASDRLK